MFDQMLINASAVGLVVSERDLNFFDVFGHEQSPYPAAMFEGNKALRVSKGKATLKSKLQVDVKSRSQLPAKWVIVVDVTAMV